MENNTENNQKKYNMSEAGESLGVKPSMIRYFCNAGLVPHTRRNRLGYRILEEWQINHIRTLLELRQAGLNNQELKHYTKLFREGKGGLPERKALLETQRRQLWQELERCQQGIDFIERQIELIDQELE